MVHLMSAGRLRYLAPGREGPEDADVPPALRRRRRARADRGRARRSAPASGCSGPDALEAELAHLGPEADELDAELARRRSSPPTRAGSTRCCATSALIAGIGRAWANEILHAARLSPYAALDPGRRRGDRAPRRPRSATSWRAASSCGCRAPRTRRPTACTTGSASRARAAGRRSPASTSRSTRSTTAPSARPTAACSRTGGCRGCCDEDRAGHEATEELVEAIERPAAAAHRGAHAADARAARRDGREPDDAGRPRRRRRVDRRHADARHVPRLVRAQGPASRT